MSTIITYIPKHLLTLPAYEPVERKKRENNNIPDVESLTKEQRDVYDTLVAYLENKLEDKSVRMLVLKGYAGTGKTYVLTQVLKRYVMITQNNIAITAPTNKAVKVLRQTANFEHSLIAYKTIHKLLGLKEKIDDKTGKISFEKEFGSESDIDLQDALAIDETSMLNDEIFALVKDENERSKNHESDDDGIISKYSSATNDLKIIFLGDPVQIPPVGKDDCIPFNENNSAAYGIKTLYLTSIIRQKEGNPILELATAIRENYKQASLPYKRETVSNSIGTVAFINSNDKDILYSICETYFASENFANDSDFMKVIAWTNRTVDFMNDKIRTYIYKDKLKELKDEAIEAAGTSSIEDPTRDVRLPRILIGEKLIANTPIITNIGYKIMIEFQTNDEFEVVSYKIKPVQVFENYTVTVYETKVTYRDYSKDKMETKTIDILHENSLHTYEEVLKTLMERAKKAQPQLRGQSWKLYYQMKNKFADIKYNYAITAHKSQGSTYDNAIVIAVDILKNKKVEERNRILYVATTRAKNNLFMVE